MKQEPSLHFILLIPVLTVLAIPLEAYPFSSDSPQTGTTAPHNDSILQGDLKADLFFLASDSLKGRQTATAENQLAAEFIRSRFEHLGLKPAGPEDSYYQPFNMMSASLDEPNRLEVATGENVSIRLDARQDFYPLRFSSSGRVRGSVVFAGFGISAPELIHEDYPEKSVEGKIVLVLDHEPGEHSPTSPFDGLVSSEYSQPIRKALSVQAKRAIGILFVQDVHNHPGPENFEESANRYWPPAPVRRQRFQLASRVDQIRIPAAQVSPALAETLLAGTGRSLLDLTEAAETEGGMKPLPLPGIEVELTTSVHRHIVSDRNVVALLEGADESIKDQWLILCAHYDHIGVDDAGQVFTGADDNASGTVALIEIAEAYALAARQGLRPRRSVLFAAWNSEEAGLLGAWAYTEQPIAPLTKTVAVLNLDMIGRNQEVPEGGGERFRGLEIQSEESNQNTVSIVGHTYSNDLMSEVERANQAFGLDLKTGYDNNVNNILRRSDQWPFLQRGVPALLLTTGFHPDYHRVTDRPESIDYQKMERIVRMVHQLSWNLAQQEDRPQMNKR